MNDDVKAALNSVPHRITNPELIPAERYYDPEFFKLENEKLWPHVWQMACRLEEIPNVGDYVEYTILAKSVIVVHTKNGVKAFPQCLPPSRCAVGNRPRKLQISGLHLPVSRMALECRGQEHLCLWQTGVQ